MHIVSSLLFGFSSSLDALLVGLACGIRQQRLRPGHQALISLITLAGTLLSLILGGKISLLLPNAAAQLAGSTVLILLGLYYLWKASLSWIKSMDASLSVSPHIYNVKPVSGPLPGEAKEKEPTPAPLTSKEAALYGAALSVNNIGMGIGASITGLRLLPTAVSTLGFSLLFLFVGNRLGLARRFTGSADRADALSGLLLIGLGIYELFI